MERLPTSSYTGVATFLKMISVFGPPCKVFSIRTCGSIACSVGMRCFPVIRSDQAEHTAKCNSVSILRHTLYRRYYFPTCVFAESVGK